jgi:hypothetical protein
MRARVAKERAELQRIRRQFRREAPRNHSDTRPSI